MLKKIIFFAVLLINIQSALVLYMLRQDKDQFVFVRDYAKIHSIEVVPKELRDIYNMRLYIGAEYVTYDEYLELKSNGTYPCANQWNDTAIIDMFERKNYMNSYMKGAFYVGFVFSMLMETVMITSYSTTEIKDMLLQMATGPTVFVMALMIYPYILYILDKKDVTIDHLPCASSPSSITVSSSLMFKNVWNLLASIYPLQTITVLILVAISH